MSAIVIAGKASRKPLAQMPAPTVESAPGGNLVLRVCKSTASYGPGWQQMMARSVEGMNLPELNGT